MNRTLSRGKNRSWLQIFRWSQALFSISTHAVATSACLFNARLCSLMSTRGDCSLGNLLLRLRPHRRFDGLCGHGWRLRRAQKHWDSPQRPRIEPPHEKKALDASVGFSASYRAPSAIRPTAPTPTRQLTRGGNVCPVFVNPVFQQGGTSLDESPHPLDVCRLAAGSGSLPDARSFE